MVHPSPGLGINFKIVDFFGSKFHAIIFSSTFHSWLFFTLLTLFFCDFIILELWRRDHPSCLFIVHPDSEIIFLLMFSLYLYLFSREKNLELYIFILLYRKKWFRKLPILVKIAHRDNQMRVTGHIPLLDQRMPNIWGSSDHLAGELQQLMAWLAFHPLCAETFSGECSQLRKGWEWFLPW